MDILLDIGRVAIGGVLLYFGAEWLVKGSAGLARAFGVKPLVIGLTVVAYGTSAPELAVSASAALDNSSAIVLGNVVGSCIANLGLILGVTALIAPPGVDGRLIRREVPVLVASAAAVPLILVDGVISWVEALILLGCSVLFTVFTLASARTGGEPPPTAAEAAQAAKEVVAEGETKLKLSIITAIGLALLIGGGELFVEGSRNVALALGMSERVVGLTIVAIGTSLPELAASVMAARRGVSGLAVGNVVGSNIFNVFLVFGAVGLIRPIEGTIRALGLDLIFLGAMTLFGVLAMRGTRRITRVEGVVFLAGYTVFIVMAVVGW